MAWKETAPGHFQRPLSASEQPMVAVIAAERPFPREPIRIHCFADFTAPRPADQVTQAFKDAWKALRLLKSPDIATTFGDGYKHYKVASSDELEAWLNETFTVAQTGTSSQSAVREMQQCLEFLPVLYLLPQSTQDNTFKGTIFFFISHWRTEAAGAFKILNQLFDYASDLLTSTSSSTRDALSHHRPGDETPLLTPSIEDILMPNTQSTPESKTRVSKLFEDYTSHLPSIDFPIIQNQPSSASGSNLTSAPAPVQMHLRTYTPTSTTSLVAQCKKHGISVTAAIHAAYLSSVYSLASPATRSRNYACIMPAQVRTRLPRSSPYRDQGCWSAAQMLLLTCAPGQAFLTRARGLRAQYALADSQQWMHEDAREVVDQTIALSSQAGIAPAAMPWFTSHGVLDREIIFADHGDARIDHVEVYADPVGPGIVLGMWTFRGRLSVEIHWNKGFHSEGQIGRVMEGIEGCLSGEVGWDVAREQVQVKEY